MDLKKYWVKFLAIFKRKAKETADELEPVINELAQETISEAVEIAQEKADEILKE